MGQETGDSFEEFVRVRSAYLFKLALLLTGQNQAEAEDLLHKAIRLPARTLLDVRAILALALCARRAVLAMMAVVTRDTERLS